MQAARHHVVHQVVARRDGIEDRAHGGGLFRPAHPAKAEIGQVFHADTHERANGRLYLESELALPIELNNTDKIALAREFAQREANIDGRLLPYTFAVHNIDTGNPHVHIMLNERVNDGLPRSPEVWFKRATPNKDPNTVGAVKVTALQHPIGRAGSIAWRRVLR